MLFDGLAGFKFWFTTRKLLKRLVAVYPKLGTEFNTRSVQIRFCFRNILNLYYRFFLRYYLYSIIGLLPHLAWSNILNNSTAYSGLSTTFGSIYSRGDEVVWSALMLNISLQSNSRRSCKLNVRYKCIETVERKLNLCHEILSRSMQTYTQPDLNTNLFRGAFWGHVVYTMY